MKLLLADDDNVTLMMLQEVLTRWGYTVETTGDGATAWELLSRADHPHLLVLDWVMPEIDGLEIVKRLRERPDGHLYYIIILTSRDRTGDVSTALDRGADDFIAKPYNVDELRARINVGRRVTCLNEALSLNLHKLEAANQTISRLAATDELTGLYNRRHFNEQLQTSLSAARRHNYPLSLVLIDLDHFKQVNDSFGHDGGDQVLKAFAGLLQDMVRTEDVIARWGGEEFIILLPHTNQDAAVRLADRIRIALSQLCCCAAPTTFSASFGVASLQADEESNQLIKRADTALYCAKQQGRNRVEAA